MESLGFLVITDAAQLLFTMAALIYTSITSTLKIPLSYKCPANIGDYQTSQMFGTLMSDRSYFVLIWIS